MWPGLTGNQVLQSELKVDTYRLAVLPIAYLSEQQDPFDSCRAESAIDESYRNVFSTGVWLYALYHYSLLVRDKLGTSTADAVWAHQQLILSGGVPEVGEGIGKVFNLIRAASSIVSVCPAIDSAVVRDPVEFTIALTLLSNLPESPVYAGRAVDRVRQLGPPQVEVEQRFAHCLSRCREQILTVFFSTFSVAGPLPH